MEQTKISTLVGHLTEIRGDHWVTTLLPDGQHKDVLHMGTEVVLPGQPGSYMAVKQHGHDVLCLAYQTWQEELPPDGDGIRPIRRRVALTPLGEIHKNLRFERGVDQFPTTGAEVHVAEAGHMATLFLRQRQSRLEIGRLSARPDIRVFLNPSRLFGRHLAILGQTGAGKSWTVASLLQHVVQAMPNAHIVLLDLHGEYCWADTEGEVHSAFSNDMMRYVDARELEIPYWLLTYEALVELLVDHEDPNAPLQTELLRDTVYELRKKHNPNLGGAERLSVDSPVYFPLAELYAQFKRANEEHVDFGKTKGPLYGKFDEFLIKLQSRFNDSRYDFLFRPKRRTNSDSLEELLRDFVGLGNPPRPITVIDMSTVPSDVRPTVSAQIGRLAFEFNYWNPKRREFPLALVCEEAHAYIPRASNRQHNATRRAMERIAKEGRKYGVGLVVVSQRPHELSETVLSQCGNFICLRLTNPDDQGYVRELLPESERNLLDILTTLRQGEAMVLGDAVALPSRITVDKPDPAPNSGDTDFRAGWTGGGSELDVASIVDHWRRQDR